MSHRKTVMNLRKNRHDELSDSGAETPPADNRYALLSAIGESALLADAFFKAEANVDLEDPVARAKRARIARELLKDATPTGREELRVSYMKTVRALEAEGHGQSASESQLIQIGRLVVEARVRADQFFDSQPPIDKDDLNAFMDRKLSEFLGLEKEDPTKP